MALNLGQRKGLAKFLYDVAKLVVAILVVAPLAKPDWGRWQVLVGAIGGTAVCVGVALWLEEKQPEGGEEHDES